MSLNNSDATQLPVKPSDPFNLYIEQGKSLASKANCSWDIPLDNCGIAIDNIGWDLRLLRKDGNPAAAKLKNFSNISDALKAMIDLKYLPEDTCIDIRSVSINWQDLIKAYALNLLLLGGCSISHVDASCRMLRLLATSLENKEPWTLNADDILRSINIANKIQPSRQNEKLILGFIKTVYDQYYLGEACPLTPFLLEQNLTMPRLVPPKYLKKGKELLKKLNERKSEQKLPDLKAFWELMRIIFTEKPRTFVDAILFAQIKIMVITGLRVGEVALLPLDWKRSITHRDYNGALAGNLGGISESYSLRYFAEKQGMSNNELGSLSENSQYIPTIFEEILFETLKEIEHLTAPLRKTLKAQCMTGRLLPMYDPRELLSAEKCYLHLTGSSIFRNIEPKVFQPYINKYLEKLDIGVLDKLIKLQINSSIRPSQNLYIYLRNMKKTGVTFRNHVGNLLTNTDSSEKFLEVNEIENYLTNHLKTKVSDTRPFRLGGEREIQPWEFMFLIPKRSSAEKRNEIPLHVGWNVNISIATSEIAGNALYGNRHSGTTLFEDYGLNEEDRLLTLQPHSLRHLQNTELFRLGVADTIITKRFNRKSVVQSYEYDHRNLLEALGAIALDNECEAYLGPKASIVAKLIQVGRANGPIINQFKNIQLTQGDDAAYLFLKAEADGFHATPYGHCLNSFTVDPCPSNLECFNGCRHLSATNLPENREHLLRLHGKLKDAIDAALDMPTNSIGRKNQIEHAKTRLDGVTKLLETPSGELVFPEGVDLSKSTTTKSVLNGANLKRRE
ncbi:MAG: hypothetical protein KGO49_00525 [Gammaproteobacteria bacterium]|nr:hypothetical protein [Gammaproteobacteria bacterium]